MKENEKVVAYLIEHNLHISTAESCTGGLVASSIVDVANASKVFNEAYVTYANESKVKCLGVDSKTIESFGVVSKQVVEQMALGVAKASNAEVTIATSGIAGPSGGTKDKPIGMVCFGFSILGKVYSDTVQFGNIGRNEVRKKSVGYALSKILELLQKKV